MRVAFLGLGTMGEPMAERLMRRGHALTVWNRTASKGDALVGAGARRAGDPREAVQGAEVVISMLSDPQAVGAVVDAALPALGAGAVWIDMSTVDPDTARATDAKVRARGCAYLDAPVSGTRKPAVDGTLLIMAGGPPEALERVRPVLEAMGTIKHTGAVGQGMAMKLVLNTLGAHMLTGFCASLVLGARHGLRAEDMLEVVSTGGFAAPLFAAKGQKLLRRDFQPDFTLALMLKDQDLVLAAAQSLGYPMPTELALRDVLDAALEEGLGDDDLVGLIRLFERWAGVEVKQP